MASSVRAPLAAAAVCALATLACARWLLVHPARVRALEEAGDHRLPGTRAVPTGTEVLGYLDYAGGAAPGFAQLLRLDFVFIALLALTLGSVAWLLARAGLRSWAPALLGLAALGTAADVAENLLLLVLLDGAGRGLAPWAAAATAAKWILLGTATALAVLGLLRLLAPPAAWRTAFFVDVPFLTDSALRRAEWLLNREFVYDPGAQAAGGRDASSTRRACWKHPAFLFFCIVMFFVAYGPTLSGLCTALGAWTPWIVLAVGGLVLAALARRMLPGITRRIDARFRILRDAAEPGAEALIDGRENVTKLVLVGSALLLLVPPLYATAQASGLEVNFCAATEPRWRSVARLALWLAAGAAFALVCASTEGTAKLVRRQAALAAAAAALLWFGLALPQAREADDLPYRHVFGALAPLLAAALATAPALAAAAFRPPAWLRRLGAEGVQPRTLRFFRYLLPRRELFEARPGPVDVPPGRVLFALGHGITARVMQIVLPPALFAFVSPSEWAWTLAAWGLAFSLLASTWGNLSRRWRFVPDLVDRWLLAGVAYFVSVFVVVVAALRLWGVDYVTTILDAAGAGVLLALVVMSYVLSWMVEYWINRVLAAELLRVLGGDPARLRIDYELLRPVASVRVAPRGRSLAYHGLGRFLVVGALASGSLPLGAKPEDRTGYHSYPLLELFRTLAGRDSDRVAEVVRAASLYFYAMNAVLVSAFLLLGAAYWAMSRGAPAAMAEARVAAAQSGRVDLAAALAQPAGEPAIVVVGSGGGTRAALYTSHVLQGLHKLGRDRSIVLASGVSGGGVALAYFAAWHAPLTLGAAPLAAGYWDEFREKIAADLIGDVLAGASEWRIFGPAPLSALLAESFERNLLAGANATLRLPGAPALILNTTIAGHPLEDARLLRQMLDPAPAGDCDEAARAFNLMAGGRLVFTNLRDVSAFPSALPGDPADTRLPYVVVDDLTVKLAQAAALNANFPPVFPNARVRLQGLFPGLPCPDRDYYVTDGGALENLGFLSALYAVKSALREHRSRCARNARGAGCALRPLHFVLAEASATGYDYGNDRGISVAVGGGKERMTGGLTLELLEDVRRTYESLGAQVHVHYLPLPLPFRARGGFGTHWMHDPSIEVRDPRPREPARGALASTSLDKDEVDRIWLALHDPDTPYCSTSGSIPYNTVRRWICGAAGDPQAPREPHIDNWKRLVDALR